MPNYVLNRNYVLSTVDGVVSFKKGEPTWVVPVLEKAAVMIGADRVDGDTPSLMEPEKPVVEQLSYDERKQQIRMAIETIAARNDAKEFTGQGVPTVKAIERIVNFDIERTEATEMWHEYKLELASKED